MDILAFCRKRDISTKGFKISQTVDWNRQHTDRSKVMLQVQLPAHFPEKYENAIGKAVDSCLVASLGKGLSQDSFARSITRNG
jgi:hypothetical protein